MNRDLLVASILVATLAVSYAGMLPYITTGAEGVINVNVSNTTVYVSFQNLTVVNFTTTHVTLGWVNSSFILSSYMCIYGHTANECDDVIVQVFNDTVLKYEADFNNKTQLCTLNGICNGVAYFNVTGFDEINVYVKDNTTGETAGPFTFSFPYTGPTLTGYAQYIAILVPYGILISLAGRMSMKNVGIGLFIYGLISPVLTVLGVSMTNIMLVMSLSIIMGVVLIWMSNQ